MTESIKKMPEQMEEEDTTDTLYIEFSDDNPDFDIFYGLE
jgi:hypothetical protein